MRWARFRSGGSSVDERGARVRAVGASRRWAAGSPLPNLGAPEVRPSMSDVAAGDPASILDSGCPTSNVERRTPNAERRMSNVECRTRSAGRLRVPRPAALDAAHAARENAAVSSDGSLRRRRSTPVRRAFLAAPSARQQTLHTVTRGAHPTLSAFPILPACNSNPPLP